MKTQRLIAAIFGLAVSFGGGAARADQIFNSLDQTVAGINSVADIQPIGASFSTGSSASVLSDVQLFLANSNPGAGSITVQLYNSDPSTFAPTTPVATLGTLADSASTSTNAVYDFSSFAPINLTANTRYWIELSTNNGSNYGLIYTNNINGLGVAGEYYQYQGGVYANNGTTLQAADEMIISTVPEPSSFLLCGAAGLMGLAYRARRSRRASAAL